MSTFAKSLDASFPGAVRSGAFLREVRDTMHDLGIARAITLPMVSICRDELTTELFARVQEIWGPAFTLAGLAGVPALGRTGWDAALAHVPDDGARGCALVLGFPHIGIERDGTIGVTQRRGQSTTTSTCGALSSIFATISDGRFPTEIDVEDYEASRLALRLVDPANPPASLVDLTISALEAVEVDIWKAIDAAEVWRDHDVVVWCGVQIHGHGGEDWIWPRDAWFCGPDGTRRAIVPRSGRAT